MKKSRNGMLDIFFTGESNAFWEWNNYKISIDYGNWNWELIQGQYTLKLYNSVYSSKSESAETINYLETESRENNCL